MYNNLQLGSYTYSAKTIDNYTLNSPTTQSVTLTEIFPNATLIFEYKNEVIVSKYVNINPNKSTYISTYCIKPIVFPNEEVIIDYYKTDFYHKEYVNEDYSKTFTVTVRVECKMDDHATSLMLNHFVYTYSHKLYILQNKYYYISFLIKSYFQ